MQCVVHMYIFIANQVNSPVSELRAKGIPHKVVQTYKQHTPHVQRMRVCVRVCCVCICASSRQRHRRQRRQPTARTHIVCIYSECVIECAVAACLFCVFLLLESRARKRCDIIVEIICFIAFQVASSKSCLFILFLNCINALTAIDKLGDLCR